MPKSPKVFYSHSTLPCWTSRLRRISSFNFSVFFLIFGFAGFLFGSFAFLRGFIYGPKCLAADPISISVAWERRSDTLSGLLDLNGGAGVGGVQRERHKVMGFVGVQTGFASVGRRRSLRKTWFPSDRQGLLRLEESTGLAFRFVIGKTKDQMKMAELKREVQEYDDFLLLDIEEEYSKLPYKTLAFFKSAYSLFDCDFYVKADDDIYLRPDRLSLLIAKERANSQTYLGCMKKGPVFTDPKLKWYEPLSFLLGSEYFLHAYGPIYALSAKVVASLVSLRNDSFRMFSNEDVTLGAWMLAMNVNHEDNRALCSPNCTPSSIAVWDIPRCSGLCNPEKKMLELHKKDICSAGPTSTSDSD
ncbi:probable beta-1,3-galactosyltransferase 14 isoform X1 [Dendrobium catenatum]|uniref:Hexosyltransferase n=1 Tax=Dendrobium catenatum TaxID=906689 RepID=A0A2I0X050_9ASPA|nr:probable beta-1,3-galactosyltransferase 14 isoform X1 [Dendrobium catenatum]PKU81267.1 putative beta-1,3-galactosyltransferase 14 [Dendrobium catenatum]